MPSQAEIDLIVNATNTLGQLQRDLDRIVAIAEATAPPIRIEVEVDKDKSLSRVTSALAPLASLGKLVGGIGAAAGTAAPLLGGVVAAAQQIGPAAAVATTGLLAMQLATQTLKLGFMGVGEAITEAFKPDADQEKVNDLLKELAPNARATVKEIISMKDSFKDLQLGVQQRLFKDFDEAVKVLGTNTLPLVRGALNRTATSLNDMGIGVAQAAVQLSNDGTLGKALRSATTGIQNLSDVPGQATTALGQLAAAAGPSFERITKAAAKVADGVSASLEDAFKSGGLENAIDGAVDAIAQLGRVGGNILGGLGNIIDAVTIDGQGLFGTLEQLSQGFEDITGTETFQTALRGLSETMSQLYTTAGPLIAKALETLGKVLIELTEPAQILISVLGDALTNVFDALGPVLVQLATTIGQVVIALLPLVTLAGTLISEILPVLTPLFQALGDIFAASAPLIAAVATTLTDTLKPILVELPGLVQAFLTPFVVLAQDLFPVLADQLIKMAPYFVDLGLAIAQVIAELAPLIAEFGSLEAKLLADLIPLITGPLIGAISALAFVLTTLVKQFELFVLPGIQAFIDLLQGDFKDANSQATKDAQAAFDRIIGIFQDFEQSAVDTFNRYTSGLSTSIIEARISFVNNTREMFNNALAYFTSFPQQVQAAIGGLDTLLFGAGSDVIQGFIDGIQSRVGSLISTLAGITNRLPDWKGPADKDARILTPVGEMVMESFIRGLRGSIPAVRAELGSLTASIPAMAAPSPVGTPNFRASMSPTILVTIGNEAVDQYVTTRVDAANRQLTRTAAQGVRL